MQFGPSSRVPAARAAASSSRSSSGRPSSPNPPLITCTYATPPACRTTSAHFSAGTATSA